MKSKSHPLLRVARLFTVFALLAAPIAALPSEGDATNLKTVDQDVQALKKQLIDLNRDLFKLEEELLYPASTQVAVFLSVNVGTFFALDSVTLKVEKAVGAKYVELRISDREASLQPEFVVRQWE